MSTSFKVTVPTNQEFEHPEGACCTIDYRSLIHDKSQRDQAAGLGPPGFDFSKFYAATDALLDAQEALSFVESSDWPAEIRQRYIWLYGALQALAIEREGVIRILECFNKDTLSFQTDVFRVNELRVAIAGHPARHDRSSSSIKGVTFLSRERMERGKFVVGTYPDGGGFLRRDVDILELIAEQRIAVDIALAGVWQQISEAREHS
jgi:hypothetical protein